MLSLAGVFGIKNSTINLVVSLLLLFLVVIWLALVYWTYADARRPSSVSRRRRSAAARPFGIREQALDPCSH